MNNNTMYLCWIPQVYLANIMQRRKVSMLRYQRLQQAWITMLHHQDMLHSTQTVSVICLFSIFLSKELCTSCVDVRDWILVTHLDCSWPAIWSLSPAVATARYSTIEGTMGVLCSYCLHSSFSAFCHSSIVVPLTVLQLVVATVVPCNTKPTYPVEGIWTCSYIFFTMQMAWVNIASSKKKGGVEVSHS